MQPNDKRTASQRIDDLERAVMTLYQGSNNMARDLQLAKDAVKLLNNKLSAMQKASNDGEKLTDEVISRIMLENQIEELKGRVKALVDQGVLVATDTITEGTFIVGSEDEPAAADGTPGKTVNHRLQLPLASLEKDIQEKLNGAKIGDVVKFKDDALVFKVLEVYTIVNPTPAEAPAEQPAAPAAAEQSSSDAAPAAPAAQDPNKAAGN